MITAVLLLMAQAAAEPVPVTSVTVTEKVAKLTIPDEIAPAVLPYMACRLRAAGTPMGRPGEPIPEQPKPSGEDCGPVRDKAARDALVLLNSKKIGPAEGRKKLVEDTLGQIDQFTLPPVLPAG